jgi:sec-independent protein translocase protein TatC
MKNDKKEMSFVEHLEELRWHIIRSLIAIGICMIFFFAFIQDFIQYIVLAPFSPKFFINDFLCQINETLCFGKIEVNLQATEPYEQFTRAIYISFIGGLVVAFPYVAWEFWRFLKPALYDEEIRKTRGFVFVISVLFLLGVAFGYFIISPFSVIFLSKFQIAEGIQNNWRIGSVIELIAQITLAGGLLFQLPVLAYFLGKMGILTSRFMGRYRRHAVVFILIIAGILTPPDPFSQIFLGLPMYLLYELSIWIVKSIEHKEKNQSALLTDDEHLS